MEEKSLAGVACEGAVEAIGNRYDLILVAARRTRELGNGAMPKVASKSPRQVVALEEIEAGLITRDYLKKPNDMPSKHDRKRR